MSLRSFCYQTNLNLNQCFENKNCLNNKNGAMQCKAIRQGHSTKVIENEKPCDFTE